MFLRQCQVKLSDVFDVPPMMSCRSSPGAPPSSVEAGPALKKARVGGSTRSPTSTASPSLAAEDVSDTGCQEGNHHRPHHQVESKLTDDICTEEAKKEEEEASSVNLFPFGLHDVFV